MIRIQNKGAKIKQYSSSSSKGTNLFEPNTISDEMIRPDMINFRVMNKLVLGFDAIVGSVAQVAADVASHTSLQTAIADITVSRILVLTGSFTETISVNREVYIEGRGRSSVVNGTWTYTSSADYAKTKNIKINGAVTFNAGADGIYHIESYVSTGSVVTDNGSGNEIQIIEE